MDFLKISLGLDDVKPTKMYIYCIAGDWIFQNEQLKWLFRQMLIPEMFLVKHCTVEICLDGYSDDKNNLIGKVIGSIRYLDADDEKWNSSEIDLHQYNNYVMSELIEAVHKNKNIHLYKSICEDNREWNDYHDILTMENIKTIIDVLPFTKQDVGGINFLVLNNKIEGNLKYHINYKSFKLPFNDGKLDGIFYNNKGELVEYNNGRFVGNVCV